ncbi:MAG: hypothetical protein KQA31_02545 [Candidatus Aenigmarchaeota archaeon]|nr:hypothetical protein [Candidatus Aenigmarchaeota archaeon]
MLVMTDFSLLYSYKSLNTHDIKKRDDEIINKNDKINFEEKISKILKP